MQHHKAFNANGEYLFFEKNRSLPQKIIIFKFNTIKHGSFDKCSSFSKRLVRKKYSLSFPSGKKIKKVYLGMENASNRPKCLVFSK